MDKKTSDYVIVKGAKTITPPKKPGYFPLLFTVRSVHPSPSSNSRSDQIERYKTVHKFSLDCDDFTRRENGVVNVNRLLDYMNVPFPLHDVQLFWKSIVGDKISPQESVASWDQIVASLADFLQSATTSAREMKNENGDEMCPLVKLEITKFEHLSIEEFEALRLERERGHVDGTWHEMVYHDPQMRMERRMVALQVIEMVKFEGGENESCCVCLDDMSVGSEVARLPCSNRAHRHCMLKWLTINNSCPFCRFKIVANFDTLTHPK